MASSFFKDRAHQRDAQRALGKALNDRDPEGVEKALSEGALLMGHAENGVPFVQLAINLDLKCPPSVAWMQRAIDAGSSLERLPTGSEGFPFTALLMAVWWGAEHHVRCLLKNGASIKAVSGRDTGQAAGVSQGLRWDASTAVHLATHLKGPTVLKDLLAAGGKVEVYDGQGRTPLHVALTNTRRGAKDNGPETSVTVLLAAGANPNAPIRGARARATATGDRPLHLAADRRNVHDVQALLDGGADHAVLDAQGRTPLDRAKTANSVVPEIVAALESHVLRTTLTMASAQGLADDLATPTRPRSRL